MDMNDIAKTLGQHESKLDNQDKVLDELLKNSRETLVFQTKLPEFIWDGIDKHQKEYHLEKAKLQADQQAGWAPGLLQKALAAIIGLGMIAGTAYYEYSKLDIKDKPAQVMQKTQDNP